MVKHNNVLSNNHFHKDWQRFVRCWYNQPTRKHRRSVNRQKKAARVFPNPLQKLRPVVAQCSRKYSSRVRYGKGFTLEELKEAGLNAKFARTVGVAVDFRRFDTSNETKQRNVQRLNVYKSKLILFPRKADKPKHGQISDSTADKLKSADAKNQNKSAVLMPQTKEKKRQKPTKITKDMTDPKKAVFQRLRQARVNARFWGIREKRAREEEAKQK